MTTKYTTGTTADRQAACAWAAEVLADPTAVVLDTETTDLRGYVVDLAVVDVHGNTVLETLVNPQVPIGAAANRIHGIGDADVADARTFAGVFPDLHEAITGRRVVIYNADFDTEVLRREVQRGYVAKGRPVGDAARQAAAWMKAWAQFECAMNAYAAFVGNWSAQHRSYTWPRLNGSHRAKGDCLAVIDVLREMATSVKAVA